MASFGRKPKDKAEPAATPPPPPATAARFDAPSPQPETPRRTLQFLDDKDFSSDVLEVLWTSKGRTVYSSAIAFVGLFIFGDWSGNLIAVDRDGTQRWRSKLPHGALWLQAEGKHLYAVSWKGAMVSRVDGSSGDVLETTERRRKPHDLVGGLGYRFLLSHTNKVTRIERQSLADFRDLQTWEYEPVPSDLRTVRMIATGEHTICFPAGEHLVWVDMASGEVRTQFSLRGVGLAAIQELGRMTTLALATHKPPPIGHLASQISQTGNWKALCLIDRSTLVRFDPVAPIRRRQSHDQPDGSVLVVLGRDLWRIDGDDMQQIASFPAPYRFNPRSILYADDDRAVVAVATDHDANSETEVPHTRGLDLFHINLPSGSVELLDRFLVHRYGPNAAQASARLFGEHMAVLGERRVALARLDF